jgi:acetyl esterase/lipase
VKEQLMRVALRALVNKPLVDVVGWKRRNGADAALDRQIAAILELQRILRYPALESMEPRRARAYAEGGLSPLDIAAPTMAEVIDTTIDTIPVRIFVPEGARPHWIVYFHGGGGVIGSIRASEPVTRYLAARTRCTVASVDYRLGPEHKHPAAIRDACAAWDGLVARSNGRVAVAGDSFGGYLSAHVDHDCGVRGVRRPDLQVLIYPLVDQTLSSPSIDRYADGYLLTKAMMQWFTGHYLSPADDRRAASPAFWPNVKGAARAIVVTAGYDPLVDEGDAYVDKLRADGVEVRHRRHASLVHGFLSLAGAVHAAHAAVDEICDDIVDMLT